MPTYSSTDDLLTGDLPLSDIVDPEKFVQDATDEVDASIGAVYETPLDLSGGSSIARHSRLLIKRIANHLATGRLILALASPIEDSQVHAYGIYLVKNATDALAAIASGQVPLEGAPLTPTVEEHPTAPLIANVDAESQVEAFYDRVANPNYVFPSITGWRPGSGFVSE